MNKAPERIWIEDEFGEGDDDQWTYGTWDVQNYRGYDVEYIRADTVQLQIDAAREAVLREVLVALQGAGSFGRTTVEKHAALEQYCLCRDAILALIRKGEQP